MVKLTPAEYRILEYMSKEGQITSYLLAVKLDVSWSTVIKAFRKLKMNGLIGKPKDKYGITNKAQVKQVMDTYIKTKNG